MTRPFRTISSTVVTKFRGALISANCVSEPGERQGFPECARQWQSPLARAILVQAVASAGPLRRLAIQNQPRHAGANLR